MPENSEVSKKLTEFKQAPGFEEKRLAAIRKAREDRAHIQKDQVIQASESGVLRKLPDRERQLLEEMFLSAGEMPTFGSLGERHGFSKEIARREVRRGLARIRAIKEGTKSVPRKESALNKRLKDLSRQNLTVHEIADIVQISESDAGGKLDALGIPLELTERKQFYEDLESDRIDS